MWRIFVIVWISIFSFWSIFKGVLLRVLDMFLYVVWLVVIVDEREGVLVFVGI